MEVRSVRSFVKRPRIWHTKAIKINAADGLPERKHALEKVQRKSQDLARVGVRPMMRVVKESAKSEARLVAQDCGSNLRFRPLVNDHDVGIAQLLGQRFLQRVVTLIEPNIELRKLGAELVDSMGGYFAL